MILFLCIGIVSAHENKTIDDDSGLSIDDNSQNDNIKDLIDNCEDKGTVKLENKTYGLNPNTNETHITLNKSVTIEGIDGETVIDGNYSFLFLDVNVTAAIDDGDIKVITGFIKDPYIFKNSGKNITFKNIIFKNLNMITWHEMKFENCKFTNVNFTSYELHNTFNNCSFNNSQIEIGLLLGFDSDIYEDYTKISYCNFYESVIKYKDLYTPSYIVIVGGDRFFTRNTLDLINSNFHNTNISLSNYNVNINNSHFNNSNIVGHSDIINVTGTEFYKPDCLLLTSQLYSQNTNFTDAVFNLHGGYFSNGAVFTLKHDVLNNVRITISPNFNSRRSSLKIEDSSIYNASMNIEDCDVLIGNSISNRTNIELFYSKIAVMNSTFHNNGSIEDSLRIRDYKEEYTYNDRGIVSSEIIVIPMKTNNVAENSYLVNQTGKYEITNESINIDTLYRISFDEIKVYYFNDKIIFELKDPNGNPVSGIKLYVEDLKSYEYPLPELTTDKNGLASYTLKKEGNLMLYVYFETPGVGYSPVQNGIIFNLTVHPSISDIKISKIAFKTNTYSQIKSSLKLTLVPKHKVSLKGIKLSYKVYTNGKFKTYYSKTDKNGKTIFKIPIKLTAGKHKIVVQITNTKLKKTINVKIAKAKTTVKAPNTANKFKKSQYFKVTLKNKATKKAISKAKVKIKVYTGKKYKTFTVKTNKKGIAKINTKKLSKGKHKVVVFSGDNNYKISARSLISIS